MSSNGYSVVPVQKVFVPLHIIQVVFGVIVLGCAAYVVNLYNDFVGFEDFTAGALGIFTALATSIFVAYWFFSNSPAGKQFYNYWAILAVEFFVWIFWLATFAEYASYVKKVLKADYSSDYNISGDTTYCYAGYCISTKRSLHKRDYDYKTFENTVYVGLAFSVLNFILFSVTLALFAINTARHRTAQGNAELNRNGQAEAGANATELKG